MDFPWAIVGTKVVCIRDDWTDLSVKNGVAAVRKGDVLTISQVKGCSRFACGVGLKFVGKPLDHLYVATGFRPLVTEDRDIAMFRVIADKALHRKSTQITEPV